MCLVVHMYQGYSATERMSRTNRGEITYLDELVLREVLCDTPHGLRHVALIRLDVDLRLLRCLIRCGDASEVCIGVSSSLVRTHTEKQHIGGGRRTLDLARTRLLVEALGVALLDDAEGRIDEDLDECDACLLVQLACDCAVRPVR